MKKTILRFVVFGGLLLALTACSGKEDVSGSGPALDADAKELYTQSCASCHGNKLSDGYAPSLDGIGEKLTAEEIEDIIINGTGSMPKGILKGEEAKKVAEWLAEQN